MTRERNIDALPGDEEGVVRRCERELAVAVRSVLDVRHPNERWSRVDSVALALEYLLRVRLSELEAAQGFGSPDGLLVRRLEASSPRSLELNGWVIEVTTQRCEPFEARVELTDDGADIRTYRLALVDAGKGLQRLPVDSREVRLEEPAVGDWLLVWRCLG
ncbi:hypothetical protein JYK02_11455 [Corallococcus macrosporus]|uniref:Uncharacterized protein n=1 Tax=Corallococcus macrosporus TaxID=35 RepID=A0ABS3D8Y6_9BACT|nr:hypothetical protein [Corallococcus macrosporus]MBN8228124.1 hypothetical protein [Corallococcus macrosporus]